MRVVFCTKSEILAQNFAAVYPSIVVRIGDAILDIVERELSDNGDEVGVCIITDGIMLKNVEMLDSVVAHMQALDCEYASDSDNMILYVRDVPKCRRYFSVATCNKIKKTINMPKLLENEYLNYLRTRLDYRSITTMSDYFIKMPPTNKIAFLRENALWRIENHCDILNCNTAELPVPELPVPELPVPELPVPELSTPDIVTTNSSTSPRIYISLSTIPPRLINDEFDKVLESLCVNQQQPAKHVIVNICKIYRRDFQIPQHLIQTAITRYIAKYPTVLFNHVDTDDGPITKITGIHALSTISDDDIIIVVDDDWTMHPLMTYYYQFVYQLYGCDAVFVNERDIIRWDTRAYIDNDVAFYDGYDNFVYGWLSFSFKFKFVRDIVAFYRSVVAEDDELWKHDDLILTLFYKSRNLHACGMNLRFNDCLGPKSPLVHINALLTDSNAALMRQTLVHKMLHKFNYPYGDKYGQPYIISTIPNNNITYAIPKKVAARNLLVNTASITYDPRDNNFHSTHLDIKYINNHTIAITKTIYDSAAICNNNDCIVLSVDGTPYMVKSPASDHSHRYTFFVTIHASPLQPALTPSYNIMQNFNTNIVTRNKFYSVISILCYIPQLEYVFFDDTDRLAYIDRYDLRPFYDKLNPGAYKSDLFRALYIYFEGGIYFDCKNVLYCPFDKYISSNRGFCYTEYDKTVINGFMYTLNKKDESIRAYIAHILQNINNMHYGVNSTDVTGPMVLGLHIDSDIIFQFKIDKANDWDNSYVTPCGDDGRAPIIKISYFGYYDENNYRNTGYAQYWLNSNVYANRDVYAVPAQFAS